MAWKARRRKAQARHKRMWASVERTPEQVTEEVFQEARRRDPEGKRPWVMLVDGHEGQLEDIHAAIERHGVELTLILDFIHVLEYLWSVFFVPGCQEAEAWVGERALQILCEPKLSQPRLRTAPERSRVQPFALARLRMAVSERLCWLPIQARAISDRLRLERAGC